MADVRKDNDNSFLLDFLKNYNDVNFIPVDSSNIESIGYKQMKSETAGSINGILFVRFNSGGLYSYYSVTPEMFNNFLNAESKGKFFWKWIRNNSQYIVTQII